MICDAEESPGESQSDAVGITIYLTADRLDDQVDIPIAALRLSGSGEIEMDFSAELPRRIHMILDEGATYGESRVAFTDENGLIGPTAG
jgi:hypothetical protein